MNKSELKAVFINAKATDAKYIGVSIQTEGSSQPEIIINPNANFDANLAFKRGFVKLMKMQNDYILQQDAEEDGEKNE